jgi:dCMP deaminase
MSEGTLNEALNPSHERTERLVFYPAMMFVAVTVSAMSTCRRRAVGCVLTLNNHIVATGYNGAPTGMKHCLDEGCLMSGGHCIRCSHAEANACLRCERADRAFCTDTPCLACLKLLLQKGVTMIYSWRSYHDPATDAFLLDNFDADNSPVYKVRPHMVEPLRRHYEQLEDTARVLREV